MKKKKNRIKKINYELKRQISNIIRYNLKDNRINNFTVSEVKTSLDLNYAKVFIFYFKKKNFNNLENIILLQKSSFFIRKILYKNFFLKYIPKLKFLYDYSLNNGIYLNKLINNWFKKNN